MRNLLLHSTFSPCLSLVSRLLLLPFLCVRSYRQSNNDVSIKIMRCNKIILSCVCMSVCVCVRFFYRLLLLVLSLSLSFCALVCLLSRFGLWFLVLPVSVCLSFVHTPKSLVRTANENTLFGLEFRNLGRNQFLCWCEVWTLARVFVKYFINVVVVVVVYQWWLWYVHSNYSIVMAFN